jgi:hypothetical protein
LAYGIAAISEQWVRGLQFWFGAWLLYTYPNQYTFSDYLISNFSLLISMMGLGDALNGISNRKEVKESARRIFALLDCESKIDPLSEQGMKLKDEE